MKIALISGSAGDNHCGVGDYAFELAQHLALDAEVHLYFDKHHGPAAPPFPRLTTLELHPLPGFSVFSMGGLVGQLQRGDYDIIHIQYPSKGFGTSVVPGFLPQKLTGLQSRSRIVVTLHEWTTSHPLRKLVMDQMLPSADALIVTNEQEMHALVGKLAGRAVFAMPVGNVLRSRRELEEVWIEADGGVSPVLPPPTGPTHRLPLSLFHFGLPARGKGLERMLNALKLVRDAGCPAVLYLGGEYAPGEKRTEELLQTITTLNLTEAVVRLGHIPQVFLEDTALRYCLGVFPFDEGFSSKRSSVATLCHLDLPLVVGAGSAEDHPFLAPEQNTAASLAVLLTELLTGRLEREWVKQVERQREYGERFSFGRIARSHLDVYRRLRQVDA